MTDLEAIIAMLERAKIKYELGDSQELKDEARKKPGWTHVASDYRRLKSIEIHDDADGESRIAVFMEFELDGSLLHCEGGYE